MQMLPGSANLFGGRGVTVKNVPTRTPAGDEVPGRAVWFEDGLWRESRSASTAAQQAPQHAMGNVAGYRRRGIGARNTGTLQADGGTAVMDAAKRPDRNLQLETLAGVLDGEIRVHNHAYRYRADEMAIMIDVAKEFGYQIASFHHAVEAYKVRDLLAENNICASMWAGLVGLQVRGATTASSRTFALVHERAKGCAIVHSDIANGIQRLNQEAAKAMRAGWEAGSRSSATTPSDG